MEAVATANEEALSELKLCAVETTGFRAEAISPEAVARVLRRELAAGSTPSRIASEARRRDARITALLHQAISVGETYFFRQPEQFQFVAAHAQRPRLDADRGIRAWSAGCASGEETYSLAAALLGAMPSKEAAPPAVLGTDLVERNVVVARAGLYRPWSVRSSAPLLYPVFRSGEGPLYRVNDAVRAVTRFEPKNLLDASLPPLAPFDVILCRNVLVYFTQDAAREVCRNLADALTPGGVILFGTMDLVEAPSTLERIGPPELQVFQARSKWRPTKSSARPPAIQPRPATRPPPAAPLPPAPAPVPPPPAVPTRLDPALAHLAALDLIEQGDETRADEKLRSLQDEAPDYVPGILERALLCSRTGKKDTSRELMRLVLKLASTLSLDEPVEGPQVLPARFYIASAEAFLEQGG